MIRRTFLSTCAAAAAGVTLWNPRMTFAAIPEDKPFSNVKKLRMTAPLDWFPGKEPVDKLEAVASWGLPAYEWLWPSGDPDKIRAKTDSLGLVLSCMVGVGKIADGGMVNPDDHDRLINEFKGKVEIAKKLNCTHLVGLSGNERKDIPREQQTEYVIQCLKKLAPIAEDNNVTIVLEALNTLVDHEGYFVARTDHTMQIMNAVNSPNVKMLFDIYHQQITEGNVIRNFTENIDRIGHFHVADNPGRKEPGTGELNYANIFKAIAGTNFKGFVALECGHSNKNYEDTLKATLACLTAL